MTIHNALRLPRRAFSFACVVAVVLVATVRVPAFHPFLHPSPPVELRARVEQALDVAHIIDRRLRVLGYERSLFGSGWAMTVTAEGTYLSTRDAVIQRAHRALAHDAREQRSLSNSQREQQGLDDYTGEAVTASAIEIDHIVPLAAAWDLGAHKWDMAQRRRFANDLALNLAATFSQLNREKSDATLSHWVPPDETRQCSYAARYLTVITEYGLDLPRDDAETARQVCHIR
ncbi:HNH endonuclease family protein [Corynebacterium anserum]|uniref:DUF1524 domain-containing protein n=1 Tax=Corynebacterium anserum TaxID=2684406 RepID=A0A7G7YP77_9CORY|nr:HNH endonuclease family protein [Corynebacterium anserum]QNH96297.1 DUF1524 domain-containing protein [Corynebacterium anserum]